MKCDSEDSLFDSETASLIQKRSHEQLNEVSKNIRSSENNRNKSLTNIKGSMPTRDINKSLIERSDNSVNITNKETGENGQSNQKGLEKKYVCIIDEIMVKHIKGWNLSNKLDQNYNDYL